jgi:hypothetical protein
MMERYFDLRSRQYDQGMRGIDSMNPVNHTGLQQSYGSKFVPYKTEKDKLRPPHQSLTPC